MATLSLIALNNKAAKPVATNIYQGELRSRVFKYPS